MTIQSNTSRVTYTGDNVSTAFPVPFLFFANVDITVVKTAVGGGVATLALNVDYTLTGATLPAGGTLTKTTALLTGETLGIFLDPPRTQLSHYLTNDIFPAATLETNLDREVQISQRLYDMITRAIRAPDSDNNPQLTLPSAISRASKYLTFDASGNLAMAVALATGTLSQATIGSFLYPQTAAEAAASATPVNFFYAPGVIDRYATNTTPGTTNMNAAFAAALAQQQAGGAPMQLLPATYLVTTNAIKTQSNVKPVVIFGVPFRSCIVNTAPAGTPTIQLIDQFTFEISGIVFAGRATFPNTAIDLTSASGGTRTGFGKIIDCLLAPNGIGIHLAGLNDLVIDSCKYWPNGMGGIPGGATNDGANALPGAIVADTNGFAGWNSGEVNAVYIRDLQVGQCNATSATPPGSGILVDGSLNGSSTAPNANHASSDWHIDGYDSGSCQRALYCRFCQFFTVENMYTIGIRIDNNCTGMLFSSIFGGAFTVDGTQTLGGNTRITYISCVGTVTADAANIESLHINNNWTTETDSSSPKQILSGVHNGARARAVIGGDGLSMGPAGAIQLAATSGAGLTILTASQTVVRINPNGACTAGILAIPTTQVDGCIVKVINLSGASFTMAASGTSHVADGVACVIPAQREMDFTFELSTNLWYHT